MTAEELRDLAARQKDLNKTQLARELKKLLPGETPARINIFAREHFGRDIRHAWSGVRRSDKVAAASPEAPNGDAAAELQALRVRHAKAEDAREAEMAALCKQHRAARIVEADTREALLKRGSR